MPTGTLQKWFEKGFGFIQPDSADADDIFVHVSALPGRSEPAKTPLRVEFDIEQSGRGPRAVRVTYLEEATATRVPRYGT